MDITAAQDRLIGVLRTLATEKRAELERHKERACDLERSDFLWHILLESFATLGSAAGYDSLIANQANYCRLTYQVLADLTPEERESQIGKVCRDAQGLRYPETKADWVRVSFDQIKDLHGPEAAKTMLLAQSGRPAKIKFLKQFKGIGDKYARNIMMIVYHEDFRDSIAIDTRIKNVTTALGLSFMSYDEHEAFYLAVARQAGINGWELDRLLFWFKDEVLIRLDGGGGGSGQGSRVNLTERPLPCCGEADKRVENRIE